MRFLVVDDEPTARTMLAMLLEELGVIDEAVDGADAIEHMNAAFDEGHPYDLICVDLSMPGLDGLDLIQHLREVEQSHGHPYRSRLIVVSASRYAQDIMSAFRNQADGYLTKPVQLDRLEKLISDFSFSQRSSA